MNTFKKLALAAGLCAAGAMGASTAMAQSTDGYHTMQVFPIVVDSASFAQRFTFRNPNSSAINLYVTYYPGVSTSQASALYCGTKNVPANSDLTITSLRNMCAGLASGTQFGFLYIYETSTTLNLPWAGFSRVANPQGNGFSVEAFPAHTFTSADAVVAGVRRLAAGPSNPAFQTNCFTAIIADYSSPNPVANTTVDVTAYNSAGTQVGSTTSFVMTPGKLNRISDVFAAVGAPNVDYDNARIKFVESGTGEPGVMNFCTVQDNTSFGADFRIAKQENGFSNFNSGFHIGAQDDHVNRDSLVTRDFPTSYNSGTRTFKLLTGGSRHNTHVMYFRNPDFVRCELIDPNTDVRALQSYGLEMRMIGSDAASVSPVPVILGGGNDQTATGWVFTGEKRDRDNGNNTRYTIEVENNAGNNGADIPYSLHCESGSGHSGGDVIEYNLPTEKF